MFLYLKFKTMYKIKNVLIFLNPLIQVVTRDQQIESMGAVARRLEEKERLLQATLSAVEKELLLRQQAMEMHKRKAIESAQSAADLKLHLGNNFFHTSNDIIIHNGSITQCCRVRNSLVRWCWNWFDLRILKTEVDWSVFLVLLNLSCIYNKWLNLFSLPE